MRVQCRCALCLTCSVCVVWCGVVCVDEIDKEGKTAPASPDSGALYWTGADRPCHQLTYHRSIPLRDIRELLLGKDSQCFQSPVGLSAIDSHCFTIRCDSRQLDLECSDEVQVTSWILGLVNLMLHGQSRSLKIMDDTPSPITSRDSTDHTPSHTLHPPAPAPAEEEQRRHTKRYSVCPVGKEGLTADYRRASAAWMKAVNGDIDTPRASRQARRATVARPPAVPAAVGFSQAQVEAKVVAPFRSLQSSFTSLRAELTTFMTDLSSDVISSLTRLSTAAQLQAQAAVRRSASLQAALLVEQRKRAVLQNKVIDLQGNIRVYCRVRPVSEREREEGDDSVIECLSDSSLIIHTPTAGPHPHPPTTSSSSPPSSTPSLTPGKTYEFDRIFDPSSTQADVYRDVAPFVQSCVDGYNVCVFAYGQTGSGKSHTMEGREEDRGVNYRALEELFALTKVEEHRSSPYSPYQQAGVGSGAAVLPPPPNHFLYSVSISCLEIYNETVVDLLVKKREQRPLDIKQAQDGGVYVADLTETPVASVQEVTTLLQTVAYPNRHTSATSMNEHSSRSHCALFVRVVGSNPATDEKVYGKLVLIDLAGSERLNRSAVTGVGVKEAQCINQSLSALGNCINALQSKAAHVPYRNSKLTYLLSDCLGGNSKCLMCCQLSPVASSYGESVCSLGFAMRARSVELGVAKRNVGGEEVKKLKAAVKEERRERERWEKETAKLRQSVRERDEQARERDDAIARLTRELREREREVAVGKEREGEREREMERLREAAARKRDKKRVEWPDTKRLPSPSASSHDAENTHSRLSVQVPLLVADIEARLKPAVALTAPAAAAAAVLSPLRESTVGNKKRKDSPTRDEALLAQKRKMTADVPLVDPQPSLTSQLAALTATSTTPTPSPPTSLPSLPAALPAMSVTATQAHSRIGAALREKYQRKVGVAAAPSPPLSLTGAVVGGMVGVVGAGGVKGCMGSARGAADVVCVTPQSLCSVGAGVVRFTSSSVAEAAAAKRGGMGEGGRGVVGEVRRARPGKPVPSTPLASHSRRGDWRA